MGWLSTWFGGKQEQKPPDRTDRKRCWEARDKYFACLDEAGVLKPGEEEKTCAKERGTYEENCAGSWIKYFNERRVLAEQQKEALAMANAQAADARRRGKA